MKTLFLTLILGILIVSEGYTQDFRDNNELIRYLETQGGLVTVKLIPQDKTLKLYLVGYEKAQLKFDELGIEASIQIAGATRKLKVTREGDHYNVERTSHNSMNLNINIENSGRQNSLKFEIPEIKGVKR